jgi:hypothetical protein
LTEDRTFQRFAELVRSGFRIHDISSTDEHLVIELDDGTQRRTLRLGTEAAREILRTDAIPAGCMPARAT